MLTPKWCRHQQLGPALALSHLLCQLAAAMFTAKANTHLLLWQNVHKGSKVQPAGNMQQKGRIRRFLGCFRKTQKACIRHAQRRSSSYVPKWRSEAHVQSVPREPRCTARGLGRGFTPAHIPSQLGSCSDRTAQAAGGLGEGRGQGMELPDPWLDRPRSDRATSCCALWVPPAALVRVPALLHSPVEWGALQGLLHPQGLAAEHTYAGSHHKNIGVSIYRNENWCKIWKLLFDVSCTTLANKPVTLNCSTTLNSILTVIQPQDREICACAYPWHKSSSKADCRELFCYTDPGYPLLFLVPNTVFFVKSSSKDYMKLSEFCISLRGIFL